MAGRLMLVVKDLHKIYDDGTHAVKGLSFSLKQGEIYGLIGPNGAGKSTTLRMIATLLKPTKGMINLNGIDVVKEPFKARRMIGYLPEEAEVYTRLTGREHLLFYAKLYGVENIENTVKYGAEISGLGDKLDRKAGEYSKGMKRRLLLALVLMRSPQLAILDEPTSGLDVYASVRVRRIIKEYVARTEHSVILSSHNMLEVEYLCDRVSFIINGKIITTGSPSELKARYNALNLEEAFVKAVEEHGET